jgi:beta-glucanase (GH16 family)
MAAAIACLVAATACQPQTPTTTTTTTTPSSTAPPTTVAPAPRWTLIGGDEFDGTSVDLTRWKPYHSNYGSANSQLECNRPSNVRLGGGTLRITAQRETVTCPGSSAPMRYTSGFLGSRETGTYYPRYARFEMRAKIPHAQGMWPAFWLRHRQGSSTAEVDVMESFHSQVPGRVTQTLHLDGTTNISKRTTFLESPTATPGWHTYAVEITPDPAGIRFTFSIDGTPTHTYLDQRRAWASAAPSEGTWDVAINLAVGGRWVGDPDGTLGLLDVLGRCSISGVAPDGCTTAGIRRVDWGDPTSTTFEVDWVRVHRLDAA